MSIYNGKCSYCGDKSAERNGGYSSLYNPGNTVPILLCEPCWLEEDDFIEEIGTNNIPERLILYKF